MVCAAFASGEKQRNTVPQILYFRGFKGIQRNHIERLGVRQREKIRENYSSSSNRFSISARALSGASALMIQAAVLEVVHSLTALSASYVRVELSTHASVTSCGCCLAYFSALSARVIVLQPFIGISSAAVTYRPFVGQRVSFYTAETEIDNAGMWPGAYTGDGPASNYKS